MARALHNLSPRCSNAFVKVNCAAIPAGLLESELFGHEKGAFTSAISQRIGRFELANRGSIFLDEIGDVSLELQHKLLRVLQEREFERLGNTRTLRTDARLIERQRILEVLDETSWVIAGPRGAAAQLGVKRSTLQARILKLGITRNR